MPPHAEKILWGERKNSVSVKGLCEFTFRQVAIKFFFPYLLFVLLLSFTFRVHM